MSALDQSVAPAWPAWPAYALVEDLLPALRDFALGGRVALATLVTTDGPSPRPVGSEMAIAADGRVAGYVSGGCVEAAVACEAAMVLAERRPRLLDYGVGSPVVDIQLTCGGRIGIFVREVMEPLAYVHALERARRERRTVTVALRADDGAWRVRDGEHAPLPDEYAIVHRPSLRLVVAGGDPVALAIARLAPFVGVDVILLRPHGPIDPPAGVTLAGYDPRALPVALDALALDAWTAVYCVSHDAETDHLVTTRALNSPAFAVGVLGSRNKIGARIERLRGAGVADDALDRLHLPAGIPIGAQTPHGIALSILAQVCQCDRARQA